MEKLLITSVSKQSTIDYYSKGEDPDTTQIVDLDYKYFLVDNIEELANKLFLPSNKDHWFVFENDKIICQTLEDAHGNIFEDQTSPKFKLWKEDSYTLYACEYHFTCTLIELKENTTDKDIAKFLDIETYD